MVIVQSSQSSFYTFLKWLAFIAIALKLVYVVLLYENNF